MIEELDENQLGYSLAMSLLGETTMNGYERIKKMLKVTYKGSSYHHHMQLKKGGLILWTLLVNSILITKKDYQ